MGMGNDDDAQTARIALEETWRQLAPIVDHAKVLKEEVVRDRTLAEDPQVDNAIRWFDTFNQELSAIQAINNAAEEASADDLRAARATADKLLETLNKYAPQVAAAGSVTTPQANAVAEQNPSPQAGA